MSASGDAGGAPAADAMPSATAAKAAWRAWARRRRRAWAASEGRRADEEAMASHLASWHVWRSARWALVYLAFGDEPDPLRALAAHPGTERAGGAAASAPRPRLATTRTVTHDARLDLHELDPRHLERHALGFAQPREDAPSVQVHDLDLVLVPGVAFDERGGRLGYGRGLYDRLLARLPAGPQVVGVTLEALVVPELPLEAHDVRMAWLLTERGIRSVPA